MYIVFSLKLISNKNDKKCAIKCVLFLIIKYFIHFCNLIKTIIGEKTHFLFVSDKFNLYIESSGNPCAGCS